MRTAGAFLKKTGYTLLNRLIKLKLFFKLFNYFFEHERTPHGMLSRIMLNIKRPPKDYFYKIRLLNGKTVITKIYKDNEKTWNFALAYKYRDPAICILETVLDGYYGKDAPWIDVGANMGLRSLTALTSGRPVYMFEPNEEVSSLNEERCRMNNFKNYEIIGKGVSSNDGEETFYYDSSSYLSSINKDSIERDSGVIVKTGSIETVKLDTYFGQDKFHFKQACVKIDVEGHEKEVIKGCQALINSISPTFIIEINEKGGHIRDIIGTFFDLGYVFYEIIYFNEQKILRQVKVNDKDNYNTDDFLALRDPGLEGFLAKYAEV